MSDKKEMTAAELGARANIHGSTLRDMAAIDFNPMSERAAYNFSVGGPTGMLPQSEPPANRPAAQPAQAAATVPSEPDIERHPLTHVDAVDRLVAQTEAHERQQQAQPVDFERMMTVMAKVMEMEMQSQTLQAVAALMLKDDKPKQKAPKP